MWMWTDKEKIRMFLQCVNKWTEFHLADEAIPEEVVEVGFERAKKHSQEILVEFTTSNPNASDFLKGWIEVGLFAGFLAGYKSANNIISKAVTISESKIVAIPATDKAKKFASELTENIFKQMLRPPINPMFEGLGEKTIQLLRISYESSLHAGFIDAIEVAYRKGWISNTPLDIETILVN